MRFEEILTILTATFGFVYLVNFLYKKFSPINYQKRKKLWIVSEIVSLFPVLLIVFMLRSFLFEPFRIPTGSMKPTLLEGDFILVNKYAYGLRFPISGTTLISVSKPKTGDIVVFRHTEGKDLIKRVIGVPGDRVRYADKQLYINGQVVPAEMLTVTQDHGIYTIESLEQLSKIKHDIYDYPQYNRVYRYDNVVVPPNSYFVMGDNRSNSEDSRTWGFVSEQDLLGKAVATWMSWDSNDKRWLPIRWSRLGKSVYKYTNNKE